MKLILAQIAQLAGALLVLYGVLLALSLLLVPGDGVGAHLDTQRASSSLFITEPKYVFMARSRLNTPTDKVILLGASNVVAGFRQPQVQALMPDVEVDNLAVGGSNLSQVSQVVDLVREVQTPAARRHNTYVIGLWYGLLAEDKARWFTADRHAGDTDIDIERYRYGFYRRTATGAVPVLPPRHLDAAVTLIHPYLVLDRAARDVTQWMGAIVSGAPAQITDAQRDAVVLGDADKRKYLAFWRDYMGPAQTIGDAPFQVLDHLVDGILAEGGHVILVDMPIPQWHAIGSPLAADYRQRADAAFAQMRTRPGVTVLDMHEAAGDDDFSDEVHPKPRVTVQWAQRLAASLNPGATLARAQAAPATH